MSHAWQYFTDNRAQILSWLKTTVWLALIPLAIGLVISVDGREIPFRDVIVALHQGESHLILPDGAYFALDKPELSRLAALIGEAQALQDRPGGPLRISRTAGDKAVG